MIGLYEKIVDALSGFFGNRLRTVVLFGSRARGDARPESDHDLFIVVEGLPTAPLDRARETRAALMPALLDFPGAVNVHARTAAEFEADLTPLYLEVIVDGICLYGEDYFEPMRRRGLAALASSGMRRTRSGRTYFWMFPDDRLRNWELTWDGYRERA